jgi:DNA primase
MVSAARQSGVAREGLGGCLWTMGNVERWRLHLCGAALISQSMKFTPEFLEEIKARLPASQIIGQRVKLKKQGREWRGLSPFNSEKTPSFYVNDQKQFYHDFSSGKHGSIFDFLMETEGLSFPEAVEKLAREAGLDLPRQDAQSVAREKARASLHEVLAFAAEWFERNLNEPQGARARGYLADRRLDAATQRAFRLGFAPGEKFGLREALAVRGVDVGQMIEAGLLVHGEEIAVPYDRFQNRVMFPIHDRAGKVVAFGGRAMEPGAKAKYLNSPETELFHKGALLFNHHRARKAAHDKGEVIAVEGYVDVIAMTQAGFPQTVAPLGTALTSEQCALLWSMCGTPILCFDGDKAGRKAAFRAIETALPLIGPDKSLRFALLPEGQDPDDLAKSGGAEAIAAVLAKSRPFADMLFLRETDEQVFETPEARAGLERRLRELTGAIADEALRKHYAQDMAERLRGLFGGAAREPKRGYAPRQRWQGQGRFDPGPRMGLANVPLPPVRLAERRREPQREIFILAGLLNHPRLIDAWADEVAALEFSSAELSGFRSRLLDIAPAADPMAQPLAEALAAAGLAGERARIIEAARRMPNAWSVAEDAPPADVETVLRQSMALQRKSGALHRELKSAASALESDPSERNLARLLDIKASLADLGDAEAAVEGFGLASGRELPPL